MQPASMWKAASAEANLMTLRTDYLRHMPVALLCSQNLVT
jgi:hypothetical protein